jgi:predicted nucleotidyltransferase
MTPTNEYIQSFAWYRGNLTWLKDRTIFLAKHGSQCYGTATPTSDTDIKGIAISPRNYYLGFLHNFETADSTKAPGDIDHVIFDIKFFVQLASKCNPNVIEMLFIDQSDWITPEPEKYRRNEYWPVWQRLYENREMFLSRNAKNTFSGYAISQLHRIRSHRSYLLNPPKAPPVREDYGLKSGQATLGKEQLGTIAAQIRKLGDTLGGSGITKDKLEEMDPELVERVVSTNNIDRQLIPIIIAERRFGNAVKTWEQYQKHVATRNPARAALEEKYGYDTKHAMHLVRLLRMAREILTTGQVIVKRPDAAELLEIRNGAWDFDRMVDWAEKEEAALDQLEANSPLPAKVDAEALDKLLTEIIHDYTERNR